LAFLPFKLLRQSGSGMDIQALAPYKFPEYDIDAKNQLDVND